MASAKPFQYLSASYPTTTESATSIDQGGLTLYDFTVNNPNLTVRNSGGWTVSNNLNILAGKVDMNSSANNVSIGKNFTVNPGAKFLHSSSNSNLLVGGDFNADEATFVANQGTVTLTANGFQKLGGGTFYKLSIPGTGTKALQGDITIKSALTLTGGVMETGNYKVILSTTENNALSETGTGYVKGTVEASGVLDTPNDFTFAGIGVTISPKSQTEAPGRTTVTRYTGRYYTGKAYGPDFTALSQSILRQYKVNMAKTTGIQFKMIFSYRDNTPNELTPSAGYNMDENTLELFRSSTPEQGGPWQDLHATTLDPVGNKVTVVSIRNITQNDVFTLAGRGRPLPVTLTKFEVAAVPAGARLNWATAMEEHDVEFVIERAADSNVGWQQVGRVKGKGSTTVGGEYSFLDANLSAGRWYYRLRQLDGKSTTATETVTAVMPVLVEAAATALQVSPVPARNEVTISGLKAGQKVLVIDGLGRQVLAHTATSSAATLPLDHLPNGLYIIRALGGESVQTLRFIKE
ncbi:T9SS type A sorting domain-containing protein [Hymenobacter tenuis]